MALTTYGARLDARQLVTALEHVLLTNLKRHEQGQTATPVCIWGTLGLGKTAVVKAFARRNGWKFAYVAPAQFEEMGDLHGLPTRLDPDPDTVGDERTVFLPPDWVPTEEGPGILLLDDINRADDRILRGLMQLLQEFELFSWSLPARWQIVCTANPEGGDYSITSMDDAMITRMLHMTLVFDVKAWAAWATEEGVDPRGIAFVLSDPELINDRRTTPRSLVQLFDQTRDIPDLAAQIELVNVLAQSTLDAASAGSFVQFVQKELRLLISAEDLLAAEDFDVIAKRVRSALGDGGKTRVDVLSLLCTRLVLHVGRRGYAPGPLDARNLVAFLLMPELPNDLRFATHRDLVASGATAAGLLRDPRLAALVLKAM